MIQISLAHDNIVFELVKMKLIIEDCSFICSMGRVGVSERETFLKHGNLVFSHFLGFISAKRWGLGNGEPRDLEVSMLHQVSGLVCVIYRELLIIGFGTGRKKGNKGVFDNLICNVTNFFVYRVCSFGFVLCLGFPGDVHYYFL